MHWHIEWYSLQVISNGLLINWNYVTVTQGYSYPAKSETFAIAYTTRYVIAGAAKAIDNTTSSGYAVTGVSYNNCTLAGFMALPWGFSSSHPINAYNWIAIGY